MKICVLFAAAVAVGSMTAVSYAQNAPQHVNPVVPEANTSEGRGLFNRLQRAQQASVAVTGGELSSTQRGVQLASIGQVPSVGILTKASDDKAQAAGIFGKAGVAEEEAAAADRPTLQLASADEAQAVGIFARARVTEKEEEAEEDGPPYHSIVSRYAAQYGVPVQLAHAVIRVESNYRATARGQAGEVGLMQIKPSTARMMGYSGPTKQLYQPETNIKYGMKYLGEAFRLGGGNTCGAILRYNAGHGARRMNPISSAYCAKVKRILGQG